MGAFSHSVQQVTPDYVGSCGLAQKPCWRGGGGWGKSEAEISCASELDSISSGLWTVAVCNRADKEM